MIQKKIHTLSDGALWNTWVVSHAHAPFLQSWEWKRFQEALGRTCCAYVSMDGKAIESGGLFITMPLPFGFSYLFSPRGSIGEKERLYGFLKEVIREKISHPTVFIRIEPEMVIGSLSGIKTSPIHPECTQILDLSEDEQTLLRKMHPKTRYNIGLAKRKGVVIRRYRYGDEGAAKMMEQFLEILQQTSLRDNFRVHPPRYYHLLFRFLNGSLTDTAIASSYLYSAEYNRAVIGGILVVNFGDTATYLHGASSDTYRSVMAPHLLQWHALKDAQLNGKCFYDFWGIAPSDSKNHPWKGITKFKKGFGGSEIRYPGTLDIPLNHFLYRGYSFARTLHRKRK